MPDDQDDGYVAGKPRTTPVTQRSAEGFVPVTVHVHVDDLASYYAAVAEWAASASGGKGRTRVT